MVSVNLFLLKDNYNYDLRYLASGPSVTENTNSVFDKYVCLETDTVIINHIKRLKQQPKTIKRANSDELIYYRNYNENPPDWVHLWNIDDEIFQRTANAIVILELSNKLVAICHGHSRGLLNPYALESRFGLITALNLIDDEKINSTDIIFPIESSLQERKKTIGTNITEFNIDEYTSMLKNIAGKVKNEYKEKIKTVDGSTSIRFHINKNLPIEQLKKNISFLMKSFQSKQYQNNFKWVDNFLPITDVALIDELDKEFLTAFNKHSLDIFNIIPTNLDYSGYVSYKVMGNFESQDSGVIMDNNVIEHIYQRLKSSDREVSLFDLKDARIVLLDYSDHNMERESYSLYSTLYYEIQNQETWYFLETGIWYEVKRTFSDSLDRFIEPYLKNQIDFGFPYDGNSLKSLYKKSVDGINSFENWYNRELEKHLNKFGMAQCLDADNLHFPDNSKIEICDLIFDDMSGGKFLIHNKYNHGASYLSHLFSQGTTSATLLTEPNFRCLVNTKKIKINDLKFHEDDKLWDPKEYTIVFGIICNKNKLSKLPLFSRINLKNFIITLRRMRFVNIKLWFIEDITKLAPGNRAKKK